MRDEGLVEGPKNQTPQPAAASWGPHREKEGQLLVRTSQLLRVKGCHLSRSSNLNSQRRQCEGVKT
jgi:hypothetical protein